MKEAIVESGPVVKILDSPVPRAQADQVVIKVVVSGSNPKDWKVPEVYGNVCNEGDDIAGVVHEVGAGVTEFKPGDRVGAFHEMLAPHGSYAEYAVAWQHTTFHIPEKTSFEEAAALPLAAMTAAVGLYLRLGLPQPWTPATEPTPLVVYGAASAVGAYVVQLARRSNVHPLICVAGNSAAHVESLIDRGRGDAVVDYRGGPDAVVEGIERALAAVSAAAAGGATTPTPLVLRHAYDAVSEKGSTDVLVRVLEKAGSEARITTVLPGKPHPEIPARVAHSYTNVGTVHDRDDERAREFGYVYFRYLARGLQAGWLRPQPPEVVPGGLGGVQRALENLKAGRARAVKYVFRIADTEGAGKD
ncbi:GroES-like protein [Xylariaceae sp. FL0804]|nr:GroES-like protein [Xylariaceae sp. FL0804]